VGLGNSQDDAFYRVFYHKKCYELGIQGSYSSAGNYDPDTIEEFTKQDSDEVQHQLEHALNSFQFVK
jgi:hypothetical protein